jgi:hypothetical protein
MIKKITKIIVLSLMILNGIFCMCNIYVLGNREEIVKMHLDLVPDAGDFIANTKVIGIFISGLLFVIAAVSIIRKKYKFAFAGIIGFAIVNGLYIVQLILWADIHPRIWIHFAIFGGLSLIYGIYSWLNWKKRITT